MKKYIIALLFTIVFIPSIALASWWNPFSWFNGWTFHKTDTQTEILENRIQELEKKLDDKSTSSATTTNPFNIPETAKKVETKAPIKPKTTTNQNIQAIQSAPIVQNNSAQTLEYKKILMNKIAEAYATLKTSSDYANNMIPFADERINELNSLISKNKTFTNSTADSDIKDIASSFNNLYEMDIDMSESERDYLYGLIKFAKEVIDKLNTAATYVSQTNTISLSEFEKLNEEYDKTITFANLNLSYTKDAVSRYLSNAKKYDDDYKLYLSLWKARIDSMSSSSNIVQPNYIPSKISVPYIPPIKTSTCSFNISPYSNSGNINCISY